MLTRPPARDDTQIFSSDTQSPGVVTHTQIYLFLSGTPITVLEPQNRNTTPT